MALFDNLIAYWNFDDNADDIIDSHDLTVVGAVHDNNGKLSKCYTFDGADDYLHGAMHDDFEVNTFSFSCWVRIDDEGYYPFIFAVGQFSGTSTGGWGLMWRTNITKFRVNVVVVKNGTSLKLYIDNVERGSRTVTNTINYSPTSKITAASFYAQYDQTFRHNLNGKIDECAFWDRAITTDEISELYNDGDGLTYTEPVEYTKTVTESIFINPKNSLTAHPTLTNNLISYWELDESSGTTASDSHGSNDGEAIFSQTTLDDCDATTGMHASGVSTDFYVYKTVTSFDATGKYVNLYVYVKDSATLAKINEYEIFLGTPTPGVDHFYKGSISKGVVGWNKITVDPSVMAQTGSPDITDITTIRFDIVLSSTSDVLVAGDVLMDYWVTTDKDATWTTGKLGNALSFNGTSDYVSISNQIIDSPSGLTIAAWFKKESGGGNYECVMHQASNTSIGLSSYWMGLDLNDKITATIGARTGVGWEAGQTDVVATYGEWYHLVATWDGNIVKVFINGQYIKQYNLASYSSLATPTRFGASSDGLNYQFKGLIDEPAIWNRALTEDEVVYLYQGGRGLSYNAAEIITEYMKQTRPVRTESITETDSIAKQTTTSKTEEIIKTDSTTKQTTISKTENITETDSIAKQTTTSKTEEIIKTDYYKN